MKGSITRGRRKKIKDALQGLVKKICSDENEEGMNNHGVSFEDLKNRDFNVIQVQEVPKTSKSSENSIPRAQQAAAARTTRYSTRSRARASVARATVRTRRCCASIHAASGRPRARPCASRQKKSELLCNL